MSRRAGAGAVLKARVGAVAGSSSCPAVSDTVLPGCEADPGYAGSAGVLIACWSCCRGCCRSRSEKLSCPSRHTRTIDHTLPAAAHAFPGFAHSITRGVASAKWAGGSGICAARVSAVCCEHRISCVRLFSVSRMDQAQQRQKDQPLTS